MKIIASVLIVVVATLQGYAQKYFTRDGKISFSSDAPMEKIEAVNNKVSSVLDIQTGDLEFAVLIKSFHFAKALMEDHFNENYLESNKYPKATFKGKITNLADMKLTLNGDYRAAVQGDLTIHGVTKPVQADGTLSVLNGVIHATSTFDITVADYNIEIPKVVRENIAKIVQIRVDINYKSLEE
ncbi:MAG TPA: YceI family protein [Saprospiraceae bacterium]|nr:YceI family protein [Saprospiraceae bacterium]